jgi:hypothetical protein
LSEVKNAAFFSEKGEKAEVSERGDLGSGKVGLTRAYGAAYIG